MADPSLQTSSTPLLNGDGFELFAEPELGLLKAQIRGVRGGELLAQRLDVALPEAGRWVEQGAFTCAWLAPGEYLVTGPAEQIPTIVGDLNALLVGELALVSDLTHGRSSFIMTGPASRNRLRAGCPLDLRPSAFLPGTCARSIFGEARIFLARLQDRSSAAAFRIVVEQSMAAYVRRLLEAPARR